ncbi:MAG: phosphatase PAP2 family protein [Anaerococcus sp.]|nr:phosphatase PAP2 family protein [Anaerococcus sp.]
MQGFEISILNAIQNLRSEPLDKLMVTITALGNLSILWISIIVVILTMMKNKRVGEVMVIGFILNLLIVNLILKIAVGRTRPYEVAKFEDLLIHGLSDNSFPSGHTSYAFTFFAIFLLLSKSRFLKIYMGILAFLMGFSRLYLYVHYPSDVIAGAIIGVFLAIGAVKIYQSQKYKDFKSKYFLQKDKRVV